MAKRTKKLSRPQLKLEALEQRQLLAGISGSGTEVGTDIHHSNGNVYDQVLLKGSSVSVTADAGQVTRVSFLDAQGDIVQAEFSGAGQLTVSMADGYKTDIAPDKYLQTGVVYVQGLASFSITGSDASTNFTVFSVGSVTGTNGSLFDATHTGGDHLANIARLTIVADPSNPNGSLFGGIKAGNALFSANSGVVGITAANVQVQSLVRIQDIDAMDTATPALVFGGNSQFVSVDVQGGDLIQTNGKAINNSGSYGYSIGSVANVDAAGNALPAKTITAPFSDKSPYPAPKSYDLTTAIDNIVGGTADDVINGSHTSNTLVVSALDKIDGGAGSDVLSINDSNGGSAQIDGLTVKNVETFMYTSTGKLGSNSKVDTTDWTGLTSANVTLQATGANVGQSFTASKDTALTINSNSGAGNTAGGWTIKGGSTVNLTTVGATGTSNSTVTGLAGTTSVSVTQTTSANALGNVTVNDYAIGADDKGKAGTISTVSVNGAVNVTVDSNALSTLSLTKVTGALIVTDELAAHATSGSGTTLALNLNESALTGLTDTNKTLKEIDITTSGDKSSITGWTTATEVTTIKVTGDKAVNLGTITGLSKLATLTGTGTAGVTATVDGTKVTVTGGDGADVLTFGDLKKAVTVGGGNDWIGVALNTSDHKTLNGGTIDGGVGTDTLSISGLDAKTASGAGTALAAQISGFEVLEISSTDGSNNGGTIDTHNLDDINQIVFKGDMKADYTVDKLASGAALTYGKTQTGNGTITVPVSAVQNETLSVTLSSDNTNVDAKQLSTGSINTVNVVANDTHDGALTAQDNLALVGPKTVNISGKLSQLTINTGVASSVDASAMGGGKLILTSTGGDGTVIKGTTKGINDITATSGKVTVTTGSDQNDTIHVAAGSTVNAGDGDNQVFGSGAGNSFTTGSGTDTIDLTGVTSGTQTIVAGDGNDLIKVEGAAISNITLGGNDDRVNVLSVPGGSKSGYFVSITGAGNNDSIDIGAGTNGTVTKGAAISLGQGASFSDYVNAATAGNNGAGNGSEVNWFTFNGDTYVVVDNSDGGYVAGVDAVVRLTGSVKLSTMTVSAGGLITIGSQ